MAGVIGLRGPDIQKRDALRGFKVEFRDADRPIIRPHTGSPVLFLDEAGDPAVDRHVFGFSRRFSSFNARDDKLEEGKMWKGLFAHPGHHGVAPVSYILEWTDIDGKQVPLRIERADGAAMAVPALVGGYWEAKDTRAFALVTIAPNAFVGQYHDRMIGQLADDEIDVWLHPEAHDAARLRKCLAAPPNDELVAYPLAADVGSAKFDDVSKLEAVGEPIRWTGKAKPRTAVTPRDPPSEAPGGQDGAKGAKGKAAAPSSKAARSGPRQQTL